MVHTYVYIITPTNIAVGQNRSVHSLVTLDYYYNIFMKVNF